MCPFDLREQTRCASRGKQGVDVWNKWREEHPEIQPDLSGAKLREVDLSLSREFVRTTDLSYTNLIGADLTRARMYKTDLRHANLGHANIRGVSFKSVYLNGADLSYAIVAETSLEDIDLSGVKGLELVTHKFPSTIGIDIIIRSQGKIPEIFLREAGVPQSIIEQIPTLIDSLKPIDYYSCFISYSSKDDAFAKRLYADLQSHNIRWWFAPEDLKIGDKFWHRIDESIHLYDKLLVVLSEHSVQSDWVEREVMAALEKESKARQSFFLSLSTMR